MPTIVTRLIITGAAAAAAVAARRGVEFGWRQVRGEEPPSASDTVANDTELRDMMVWPVILTVAVLLARKLATSSTEKLLGERA